MAFDRFPLSVLSPDEDLVFDLRPHWISLASPFAQTLAIAAGLALAWLLIPYSWGVWAYLAAVFIAVALVLAGPSRPFTEWLTSHFVLTTSRVIRRSGWIAKQSIEIPLEKISDVRFHQRVVERILGTGDLTIESAGRTGQERLENCRDPERAQKLIYEMKERAVARADPAPMPVGAGPWLPVSVADELTKLHQLLGQGVLTHEEFQEAKVRLLKRV
jgi:membrane protein YdbS with pleckstrin-like domain